MALPHGDHRGWRRRRGENAVPLDNLGTDHLDIYFLHSGDFGGNDRYLAGAIDVMRELREQGMIRAIGMRAPHTFAEEWAAGLGRRAVQTTRWLHLVRRVQPNVVKRVGEPSRLRPRTARQRAAVMSPSG